MTTRRQQQVSDEIAHLAALFIARESNQQSLVTVTRADVSPDLKNITIFVSVLPETMEKSALNFLKRNRTEFRNYLKTRGSFKFLPTVDFELDTGEKNRQRVQDLTSK